MPRWCVVLVIIGWTAAAAQVPDVLSCSHYRTLPTMERLQCPDDLLFDSVLLDCVPPDNATCLAGRPGDPDNSAPVVRKCCPEHQQFSLSQGACVARDGPWRPPVFSSEPLNADAPQPASGDATYTVVAQSLSCGVITVNTAGEDPLFLLDTGHLYVQPYRRVYSPNVYCLEAFVTDDGGGAPITGAALCSEPPPGDVVAVEDHRLEVPRCCARRVPLQPAEWCRTDAPLAADAEVPPPVAVADARPADGDLNGYRFTVAQLPCNASQLVSLHMGSRPFAVGAGGLALLNANVTVPVGSFCVNELATDFADDAGEAAAAVALVCADDATRAALEAARAAPSCGARPCVRKCCPPGYEVLVADDAAGRREMACVASARALNVSAGGVVADALLDAPLVYGQPPCADSLFEVTDGNFSVLASGVMRLVAYDEYACNFRTTYDASSSAYCVDTVRGSDRPAHAFYCFPAIEEDDSSAVYIFFPILMGITDFFLLVTFIVYMTVPDPTQTGLNKKRKLSQSVLGMILLAYISSLFFAYLVLMIVQTATTVLSVYRTLCKVLAVILYFFLLSAFFWLSVICFEIYLSTRADKRTSGRKRFRLYGVYAWCCPLLMASLALIMDLAPGIDSCSVIKPAFGRYRCLFQNRKAFVAYFYIPIGVLLSICLLLYILTVKNLSVPRQLPGKGDSTTMSQQSAKQQSKRRKLCAKLFLIMGITWVAELLSYFIGDSVIWYLFDVINILQGFFIFVAFILRPKVLQYIKKTALHSLSRSFGHESQHDGGGGHRACAHPGDPSAARRNVGQPASSPMTMSTRTTGTRGTGTGTGNVAEP